MGSEGFGGVKSDFLQSQPGRSFAIDLSQGQEYSALLRFNQSTRCHKTSVTELNTSDAHMEQNLKQTRNLVRTAWFAAIGWIGRM